MISRPQALLKGLSRTIGGERLNVTGLIEASFVRPPGPFCRPVGELEHGHRGNMQRM